LTHSIPLKVNPELVEGLTKFKYYYKMGITMQIQPTTITQKGQVAIPAPIRRALGLKRGDKVKFTITKKKVVQLKPVKKFSIMSLYGSLKPRVKYKKTDDIYKIIKKEEQAWPEAARERYLKSK